MDESKTNIKTIPITELPLWKKARKKRVLLHLSLELTARCNNACSHCYLNLPENDSNAIANELSYHQITNIIDEAVDLGCLWVNLTGGEPLLRKDFSKIYTYLVKKGLLISIFTNASLISDEHLKLFKKYPPRDIEVSVYGVTQETHKRVTKKNLFSETLEGIKKLTDVSLPVTLKATLLKSNFKELNKIQSYCENLTKRPFRFDPFLHLRIDRDKKRNREIRSQRISTKEIIELEKANSNRINALQKKCKKIMEHKDNMVRDNKIFKCEAGLNSCYVGHDGTFRLCGSLTRKDCIYNLITGSLSEAWKIFTPRIISITSDKETFKRNCMTCDMFSLCAWCPAHADLEVGELDQHIPYFCDMTKERFKKIIKESS